MEDVIPRPCVDFEGTRGGGGDVPRRCVGLRGLGVEATPPTGVKIEGIGGGGAPPPGVNFEGSQGGGGWRRVVPPHGVEIGVNEGGGSFLLLASKSGRTKVDKGVLLARGERASLLLGSKLG